MTQRSHEPASSPPAGPIGRPSEAGSAYLVAILALVVLTIAGLSLALITQTEMQIGANEKMIQRSFYAADSGISISTARTLVERRGAWSDFYRIQDPEGYGLRLEHLVEMSPFFPIATSPCNLCDISNAGQYGSKNFQRTNHAVTSIAVRRIPGSEAVLAERSLAAMMEFQPWELLPDQVLAVGDEDQLAKIKY
jgi:hypothetical protein